MPTLGPGRLWILESTSTDLLVEGVAKGAVGCMMSESERVRGVWFPVAGDVVQASSH